MLLNYLYSNFLEEREFAQSCQLSVDELHETVRARVAPSASYVLETDIRSISFVADRSDQQTYRFHLKSHVSWIGTIRRLEISTEAAARAYFEVRYRSAKEMFLSGELGRQLNSLAPEVVRQFGHKRAETTWRRFLDGVYGVCTRDGMPETVFLKQVGVDFVDYLVAPERTHQTRERLPLLRELVDFLDGVESEFAPHEAVNASRRRCIDDVRARFLVAGAP